MVASALDSWALMAFFKSEPAGATVEVLLQKATGEKARLLFCVVNWGEVCCGMWRAGGKEAAEAVAADMAHLPLELVEADVELSRQAASYKATHILSYADCFAAALAKEKKAELVTGDPEFKAVAKEIKINWLK